MLATDTIPAQLVTLDPRFECNGDERVERLFTGARWLEGPVYHPAGRYLLCSDIPNDRMLRWDETTGTVGVFRQPAGHTNGHTLDGQGRLVSCEQGNRRVTRTEHDGTITVLADNWQGKRLNSPNDVVVRSDGSVWFTDPSYGIDNDYEGNRATSEIGACHVYRVVPGGQVEAVVQDAVRPNGLAFSPDERRLYLADTRRKHIRVFDVTAEGGLTGGEVLAECDAGSFDGLRVDDRGMIWAAAHDGVHCYHPDGTRLGRILLPEIVSNLVFGGPKRNMLFMTATTSVYVIRLTVNGCRPPWAAR
ncbi:SMP-30/gluconolactonase/LRE family protein [Catellatospora coxensis]|uniref:SMP-30/gluconolactonase/LRE family protein n=1 Tax=Catellatospora coxensis TaxID=310354 RepID=UPI001EF279C7|nr:SMP-30/gluconolactonase/LRE family protein [Catellatospora coxensis]